MVTNKKLLDIYNKLHKEFGPMHWWPADSAFEVIIGAILTQNTSWKNVERAVANLKKAKALTPPAMAGLKKKKLAALIKPAGYYNVKAGRIRNFLDFLMKEYSGSLKGLFKEPTGTLRKKLLEVNGIGPETADSILLYSALRPVFVVDAYTKRIFSRHKIISPSAGYEEVQRFFTANLPRKAWLFNEYHALIVNLGKDYCRKKPLCKSCPLGKSLSF